MFIFHLFIILLYNKSSHDAIRLLMFFCKMVYNFYLICIIKQQTENLPCLPIKHVFFSSLRFRDYLYFYQNVFGKCFYRNAGACGLFREIVAVYGVERGKVVHVG